MDYYNINRNIIINIRSILSFNSNSDNNYFLKIYIFLTFLNYLLIFDLIQIIL